MSAGTYLDRPAAHWAELLDSPDPIERRLGAYALGELGPDAAPAAARLVAALADPVPFVRVWAAAGLARVDPEHGDAVAALVEATSAEQAFVRSLAAWMLGRLEPLHAVDRAALTALERLQADDDPSVRIEAAQALARLIPHP